MFGLAGDGDAKPEDLIRVAQREHPTFVSLILRGSDPESTLEHTILLQHEERFSGQGYPQGLRGDDLPPRAQRRRSPSTMLPHSEIVAAAIEFERLRIDPAGGETNTLLATVGGLARLPAVHRVWAGVSREGDARWQPVIPLAQPGPVSRVAKESF
ncbi:MAG: hypothetical protein MAG453_01086 [Calditrichaeota bacterium]|nr:hypothetical protein [Calditrichota bacterium]